MASREQTLIGVRILHFAFLTTIFLFVFAIHMAAPPEGPVSPTVIAAIVCVAVGDIALGFTMRKRFLDRAAETYKTEGESARALGAWRFSNLYSFAHAEIVALFGLVLKFLGVGWKIAGPFFAVSLALQLLWAPRMDWPVSTTSPTPPPPAAD